MLRVRIHEFANNEAGAGTVMGLLWFILLVGITGMAVDITDGLRNRTMLQATADAAALAGAIDLPDQAAAVATAVSYAADNMGAEINGSVLNPDDVRVGLWDPATQSLDTTSLTPDAVMVTVRRSAENANAVPVNFLRIVGLQTWNVVAQAVAQRFIPDCLRDGLIAREPSLPIGVLVADCVPVYFFDPIRRAGGIVHAGRAGTYLRIVENAIHALEREQGVSPGDLHALIGPSAGPCCYEVSEEIARDFDISGLPVSGRYLDLWQANVLQLEGCGVPRTHIGVAGLCTLCDGRFHSHRRNPDGGRNLAFLAL